MLSVGVLENLAYEIILEDDLPSLDNVVQQTSEACACMVDPDL